MDFFRNADKQCDTIGPLGLYNSVINVTFQNEGDEPVGLTEAKLWCKLDSDTTDDDLITALITAARQTCENYSCISFVTKVVVAAINNPNGMFVLPYGPVTSDAADITLVDVDGEDITFRVMGESIVEATGECTVSYDAGLETLPANLKTALKMQLLYMYENRGDGTATISPMAKMILEPIRRVL